MEIFETVLTVSLVVLNLWLAYMLTAFLVIRASIRYHKALKPKTKFYRCVVIVILYLVALQMTVDATHWIVTWLLNF